MTQARVEWRVSIGDDATTAVLDPIPGGNTSTVYVCGHGAGGHMFDRAMDAATKVLVARGVPIVRFNFLYKEKGSGRPDPMPVLKQTYDAVVSKVREALAPTTLVIGGRSMGGRVASMLAADGFRCDGLLLLAYPMHPDGRPDQLRDQHLPSIRVPVLCFNGTRDTMCTPELMTRALVPVTAPWEMHWLEGADHSFHVLKRSGRTDADVLTEVGDTAAAWVAALGRR